MQSIYLVRLKVITDRSSMWGNTTDVYLIAENYDDAVERATAHQTLVEEDKIKDAGISNSILDSEGSLIRAKLKGDPIVEAQEVKCVQKRLI